MPTSTIFSTISYNQNQGGPIVPADSVVNAGAPVTQRTFTLTVSPATGWAKASIAEGADGINFPRGTEIYVAPNSGGSATDFNQSPIDPPMQYFTGRLIEVSPGATATLTVSY